ncbi:MAG: phage tail spike protein [Peptostreptococcaceae bacterium]
MLKLYNKEHEAISALTNLKDYKIEYLLSGEDSLEFSLSICDEDIHLVEEEGYIRNKNNEYVIKAIDPSDNFKRFSCVVNIEDIKAKSIKSFDTSNNTIAETIRLAIAGTGWILSDNNITKRRTVRLKNTNALEVLREARKVFRVDFRFDVINKIIYVYEQFGEDRGVYFSDELNLRSLSIPSDTYDYATRIYPYGKDGLDIKSVNGGKEHIDNFQYSNKVIELIWEDNRYTDVNSLKSDAEAKLEELSKPKRSYQATISDLAKQNEEYSYLDFFIGDTITLLSKQEKFRDKQRIVKYIEYPNNPSQNTCELGNTTLTFEELQKENESKNQVVDNITSDNGTVDGSKVDNITTGQISNFEASVAKITDLTVINAKIENLTAQNVTITGKLTAVEGEFGTLKANVANIDKLVVNHTAEINNLIANSATITDLKVTNATIDNLEATVGKIQTLVNGNLSSENIQAGGITSDKLTISNGFITNAMISNLDVSKVNAGDISTNKFKIKSDDGGIEIVGATQQFKDKNNRVRIQMGKDTGGNFNFILRGEDGSSTLIDHTGVKAKAIADDLIISDMISQDAVGEKQINYSSFATGFNKDSNTNTIKSTKIMLNNKNQTLDVAFNSLETTVENIEVGGRNLVVNSNVANSYSKDNSINVSDKEDFIEVSKFTTNIYSAGVWKTIRVEPNTQYTISFIAKDCNDTSKLGVGSFKQGAGTWWDYISMKINPNNSNSITFTTREGETKIRVYIALSNVAPISSIIQFKNLKLEKGNKATDWTPAIEDTNDKIDSIKEITTSQSTTIGVMQGQISTAINNTQIIKDGQSILLKDDYSRTVQTVNSINSTIGSHKTLIDQNIGKITGVDTKVNTVQRDLEGTKSTVSSHTSQLSGLNSTVSTQGSSIEQLKSQISLKVEKTDVEKAINDLEIGGRNLFIGSDFKNPKNNNNFTLVNGAKIDNVNGCAILNAVPNKQVEVITTAIKIEKNTEYTFSAICFENTVEGGSGLKMYFGFKESINGQTTWKYKSVAKHQVGIQSYTINTGNYSYVYMEFNSYGCTSGTAKIGNYKLEKGNKSTDWTPAIEDISKETDSKVSNAKAEIKLTTDSISQNISNLTKTVSTKADGSIVTDINNKVASIENSLGSITSRVSSVESTTTTINGNVSNLQTRMSSAEQKITSDAIINTVSSTINDRINGIEIGGRNLLIKSNDENTYAKDGGITCSKVDNWIKLIKNTSSTSSNLGIWKDVIVTPNTTYTISLKVGHCDGGKLGIGSFIGGNNVWSEYGYHNFTLNKFFSKTFTTFENETKIRVFIAIANGQAIDSHLEIINIKFEKGNKATDWTPAIEDTTSQIESSITQLNDSWTATFKEGYNQGVTQINKDGVTVTASNVKSKTNMGANGFKITKTDTNEDVFKVNSNGRLILDGEFTTHNGARKSGYFGSDQIKFYNWWSDSNEEIARFYGGKSSTNQRSAAILGLDTFSMAVGTISNGSKVLEGSKNEFSIFKDTNFNDWKIKNVRGINQDETSKDLWINKIYMRHNQINSAFDSGRLYLNYWRGGDSTTTEVRVNAGQNDGSWGRLSCGDFKAYGTKNACVQTDIGYVDINAYETADYYFGDIGETILDNEGYSYVYLDSIFKQTVNTNRKYQVFLSIYGEGSANVIERNPNYFVVKGTPNIELGYEIKAKRKGYEDYRLERDVNSFVKGKEHGLDLDYEQEKSDFNTALYNEIEENLNLENKELLLVIDKNLERAVENKELINIIEEGVIYENIN